MESDNTRWRHLLCVAVAHATAIDSLIERLAVRERVDGAGAAIASASRAERDGLCALVESDEASMEACAAVLGHLVRLESLLALAVEASAESARAIADRLALMEEFSVDRARGRFTSSRAATLGDELDAAARVADGS